MLQDPREFKLGYLIAKLAATERLLQKALLSPSPKTAQLREIIEEAYRESRYDQAKFEAIREVAESALSFYTKAVQGERK